MECLELYRSAVSPYGADLLSVRCSFFGTMYIRDYYKRISALLFIQRNKAGFSYSINLYCCQNELMPIFAH